MLIKGIGLGDYQDRAHLEGEGEAAAHLGLHGTVILGADLEIQGPGILFRKAAQPQGRIGQGGGRGQDKAAEFEIITRFPIEVELVAGGGTGGSAADAVKIEGPPQVVKIEGIAQGGKEGPYRVDTVLGCIPWSCAYSIKLLRSYRDVGSFGPPHNL